MTTHPAVPRVRDDVLDALRQHPGATATQLAALVPTGGSGLTQIRRALRQLETASLATRERGRPWASPDQWHALPSG